MTLSKSTLSLGLALGALSCACAGAAAAPRGHRSSHSPLASRQLWATVDVCSPHDQPGTIGIRGSMPGDGNARDTLYMRFQVQYLDPASRRWTYVQQGADSGFMKIGSATVARQGGRSFQFAPAAGKPAFALRGVVTFQWRRGSSVVLSTYRTTSAGHKSVAGADPQGYSAATCTLS